MQCEIFCQCCDVFSFIKMIDCSILIYCLRTWYAFQDFMSIKIYQMRRNLIHSQFQHTSGYASVRCALNSEFAWVCMLKDLVVLLWFVNCTSYDITQALQSWFWNISQELITCKKKSTKFAAKCLVKTLSCL